MDLYTLPNVTEPQPTASFVSLPPLLSATSLVFAFIGFACWCVQDYRHFLSLGPGGPPYNVFGWILVSFLVRPFTLAAQDTVWTGDYPEDGAHKEIIGLSDRKGDRPLIIGIAPQRQFGQLPSQEMNTVSFGPQRSRRLAFTNHLTNWQNDISLTLISVSWTSSRQQSRTTPNYCNKESPALRNTILHCSSTQVSLQSPPIFPSQPWFQAVSLLIFMARLLCTCTSVQRTPKS